MSVSELIVLTEKLTPDERIKLLQLLEALEKIGG